MKHWFVYGRFPGKCLIGGEPQMTALVGVYHTETEAEEKRAIENLCWSDEGLIFTVEKRQLIADCTYEQLCERVEK